jgi:HD-GYP domain-containing protein (c-di-GMP phosphodiesterase class II)
MKMSNNEIRNKVKELVTGLSRAMQANAMYGEDHKLTKEAAANLHSTLEEILTGREEITVGIIGDEIAFEKEPYYEISRTIKDFIDHLKEINIKKITFGRGIDEKELVEFIKVLSTKAKDLTKEEGIDKVFESTNIVNIAIGEIGLRRAEKVQKIDEMSEETTREKYEENVEYLTKAFKQTKGQQPLNVQSARQIVSGMIEDILKNKSLLLILTSLKGQSQDTFAHGVNVAVFTLLQAEALGLEEQYLADIGVASLLHDSGTLLKGADAPKDTLEPTKEEQEKTAKLDVEGAKTLLDTEGVGALAAIVAFEHNMDYDMSGYPKKLYGKGLNLVSMMISISEYYDKLKRAEKYQKEGGAERIYEDMMALSGKKFHPDLLNNFFNLMGVYPPGTLVALDTKEVALVIQPSTLDIRRPQAEILYDTAGNKYKEPSIVNLMEKDKKGKFKRSIIKSVAPLDKMELPEKHT